jgi:hypothetical protein
MSESQDIILKYIKSNQPVDQAKIVENFLFSWEYKSKASARNAICQILRKMEASGLIKKGKAESGKFLKKNVWWVPNG